MTGHRPMAAVIPTAGFSTRMGRLKPLLPLSRGTIIEQIIHTFKAAAVEEIIVVIGHRQELLRPLLQKAAVQMVENPDFEKGMFTSIATGVRRISAPCSAFFVLPADIPLVRPQTLRRLAHAHAASPASIVHPIFEGRHGHPPLIPTALADHIIQWSGNGGLKACLDSSSLPSIDVPVADRHILIDMDTEEDYRHVCRLRERLDIPTAAECDVILTHIHPVTDRVKRHCRAVADVALCLSDALNAAGLTLDPEAVRAGGLLHDMAKGVKDHALVGRKMLEEMGFSRIGEIVGAHTDLEVTDGNAVSEADVVHLADKLVQDDRIIDLEQRFQGPLRRWAHDPVAADLIRKRRRTAVQLKKKIETILGRPLKHILPPHILP